ncbi:PRC-barrel domain-containing protein [Tabrizicola sp.]|uniref:PRC-barrel domain-containing protein n=1 Tax=Tabrizicola sp. TaxID=2005166 RepID=UPI0027362123|nr:PRC-barrel domain-containing protein [Tabrizicola sp.]MDP3197413.1 PRC-barrel domain-containing protein [Tabrizicola sp.]
MKALLLTTALAAGFALPAMAQDAASPFQTEAAGPSLAASEVIGARVYASEGALDADAYAGVQDGWEDIGEVNDIILGRDGTVDAVLVDIGGFLGMGERQVAVDMAALKVVQDDATDADDWFLVLQSDRATLEGAPEYMIPGMATDVDANADVNADATATDTTQQGTATDEAVAESTTAEGTEGVGNATDTEMPADGAVAEGTETEAVSETAPTVASDGTMTLPEGYTAVERDTLTAELLTGADVRGSDDASIAEVSDLVLTGEGQVTDVILDVGGFLGIGARSVAIPMDRLTVAQTEGGAVRLWVNMTKEELEALPEYKVQ